MTHLNIRKPNLFIVGAPKCGTSAWYQYLKQHPDIHFSELKEPNYFCFDLNCRKVDTEEAYLDLFKEADGETVIGEASVRHIHSEVAAQEIREFNPDAKIIVFVRAQEDFLPSIHNQALYRRNEWIEDFKTAWELSGKREWNSLHRVREPKFLDYKSIGRFSEQVERYFAAFPEDQVRVFHFRDWSKDPRETYIEILRFVGVQDDGKNEFEKINEAKHQRRRWLATLLINPPKVLAPAAHGVKRMVGPKLDSFISFVMKLNRKGGYLSDTDKELRREVRKFYEADNVRLEPRIWKPASSVEHHLAHSLSD